MSPNFAYSGFRMQALGKNPRLPTGARHRGNTNCIKAMQVRAMVSCSPQVIKRQLAIRRVLCMAARSMRWSLRLERTQEHHRIAFDQVRFSFSHALDAVGVSSRYPKLLNDDFHSFSGFGLNIRKRTGFLTPSSPQGFDRSAMECSLVWCVVRIMLANSFSP